MTGFDDGTRTIRANLWRVLLCFVAGRVLLCFVAGRDPACLGIFFMIPMIV